MWWIRQSTLENRLMMTKYLAEEIADRFVATEDRETQVPGIIKDRDRFIAESKPDIYVLDPAGKILFTNPPSHYIPEDIFPYFILKSQKEVEKVSLQDEEKSTYYIVKRPIKTDGITFGWVVIIHSEEDLANVNEEYELLIIMLISLAILGWLAIYILSKKLSRPIQQVSEAAKHIQEGNYDVQLPENMREQEVSDLVHSFKEMANRLQQLETLRAELLAGVTHELKTPVTSISGLLQAVKDEVVTGEEAKEFLDISLKEISKMQKMVADLLEFNSFAAGAIPISLETHCINELVKEITYQWKITQKEEVLLHLDLLDENDIIKVDPLRLQQILVNLLNNGRQAVEGGAIITVRLYEQGSQIVIDVTDNGGGIPLEEQEDIFERFFRGENKKLKVRGLGLGLPFSEMIAKAMGGDLQLQKSDESGTTFSIYLPKINGDVS